MRMSTCFVPAHGGPVVRYRAVIRLAGGAEDGDKVSGLQAGPAHEGAVDVGPGKQVLGVIRLHTTAVLDTNALRGVRSVEPAHRRTDDAAHPVRLFGGTGFT